MSSDLFSFCSKRAGARFFLPIGGAEIRDALHCIVFLFEYVIRGVISGFFCCIWDKVFIGVYSSHTILIIWLFTLA